MGPLRPLPTNASRFRLGFPVQPRFLSLSPYSASVLDSVLVWVFVPVGSLSGHLRSGVRCGLAFRFPRILFSVSASCWILVAVCVVFGSMFGVSFRCGRRSDVLFCFGDFGFCFCCSHLRFSLGVDISFYIGFPCGFGFSFGCGFQL